MLDTEMGEKEMELVANGTRICIVKSKGCLTLNFFDEKTSSNQSYSLSSEHNQALIEKLHLVDQTEKMDDCFEIEDKELIEDIRMIVEQQGGRYQKICRSANRIFFAAGLFSLANEKAKNEGIPISESLFSLQYKSKADGTHELNYNLQKVDSIYLLGLEKLKKYNADLELSHPFSYAQVTKLPLGEEMQLLLEEFMKNEDSGCCIM